MTADTQPDSSPENTEVTFRMLMEGCSDMHKQIQSLAGRLAKIACLFETAGDAMSHAEGSDMRLLAELRDHADFCLNRAAGDLNHWAEVRAETSRSPDLVCDVVGRAMGDGNKCIKLIETYYRMMGDDTEGTGQIDAETFPDQFLWDLAERVETFPKFAERYPKHLHFAARHLQGLPLLVSHHLDVSYEFDRLSALLGMGTWHPLDVSPRRKRGAITPAMQYLEPVVWRMDNMRRILTEIGEREGQPIPSDRISGLFTRRRAESVPEAEIEIYRKLTEMPGLIRSTAPAWSKKVIVPYILATDGADPANAEHPFLRNIWNYRDVKSTAT
jgi:hypothetical protein